MAELVEAQVYETQVPEDWGPYPDYVIVTTPYGDYGLPRSQILRFTFIQKLNKETSMLEDYPVPHYEKVLIKDERTEPLDRAFLHAAAASGPNAIAAQAAAAKFEQARQDALEAEAAAEAAVAEVGEKDSKIEELEARLAAFEKVEGKK